jgi:hypothetical protein
LPSAQPSLEVEPFSTSRPAIASGIAPGPILGPAEQWFDDSTSSKWPDSADLDDLLDLICSTR